MRRGYTLMEMLLVLAILVAAAALSMPSLRSVMRSTTLNAAADAVRTAWTSAHVKAMKTGRIQVFRYDMGGRKYILEPYVGEDDELEGAATDEAAAAAGLSPVQERELPDGTTFVAGDSLSDSRGTAAAEAPTASGTEANWSQPILFYPDGTSSDAYVVVGDDEERGIRVDLRGMTGAAKVGSISAVTDLQY